jgi:hypothetical protein
LADHFGPDFSFAETKDYESLKVAVNSNSSLDHQFGFIDSNGCKIMTIRHPKLNLPVGTLQEFLDIWMKKGQAAEIDYVHGDEAVYSLSTLPGNAGFYMAGMLKSDLFRTVITDGSLPRKTFSMGEAHEKRFYFEARRIS